MTQLLLGNKKSRIRIALILLLWILSIVLVNITGEFPLFDDWAYAKSVRDLSEYGHFKIYDRVAITFCSNLLWGALFAKLFGFSFLVLRISTIVASLILLYTFNKWLSLFEIDDKLKSFCVLLFAFNPLIFFLSVTFMTDIFFLMSICLALYFFTRYFKEKKASFLIWAFLFVIIGTLSRQVGIMVPIAFLLVTVFSKQFQLRHKVYILLGAVISIFTLYMYYVILAKNSLAPTHYTMHYNALRNDLGNLDGTVFKRWIYYLYTSFVSLTVILSPLVVYKLYLRKINGRKALFVFLGSLAVVFVCVSTIGISFPFKGEIIHNYGIGTYPYADQLTRIAQLSYKIPDWFNIAFVSFCVGGFVYLLIDEFKSIVKRIKSSKIIQFLLVIGILYYPTFGLVYVFDRYLALYVLILIPLFLLLFKKEEVDGKKKSIAYAFLALLTIFTLIGTHDYFEYKRVKWKALNTFMNDNNISAEEIDGGMEFNAWYLYEDDVLESDVNKEWWCVHRDNYLVSIDKQVEGYQIHSSHSYSNWLGLKKRTLYILKRELPIDDTATDELKN